MSEIEELDILIQNYKDVKQDIELFEGQKESLKEKILTVMQANNIKKYKDSKMDYPHSFDVGRFKMEYPEKAKEVIKQITETITQTRDVFDKKEIQAKYPEEYESCNIAQTPRLTVK